MNTKNTNMVSNGGAARQNTQASYNGNNKSPSKAIYTSYDLVGDGNGPNGPSTTAGPSGQARGGAVEYKVDSLKHVGPNHQASSGKLQKKKAQNLSGPTNQQAINQKLFHQS